MLAVCAAVILGTVGTGSADPWKDEFEKGRWRGEFRGDYRDPYPYIQQRNEYKQEFYYQGCKIKREWKRDGGYKEEVKCEGRR